MENIVGLDEIQSDLKRLVALLEQQNADLIHYRTHTTAGLERLEALVFPTVVSTVEMGEDTDEDEDDNPREHNLRLSVEGKLSSPNSNPTLTQNLDVDLNINLKLDPSSIRNLKLNRNPNFLEKKHLNLYPISDPKFDPPLYPHPGSRLNLNPRSYHLTSKSNYLQNQGLIYGTNTNEWIVQSVMNERIRSFIQQTIVNPAPNRYPKPISISDPTLDPKPPDQSIELFHIDTSYPLFSDYLTRLLFSSYQLLKNQENFSEKEASCTISSSTNHKFMAIHVMMLNNRIQNMDKLESSLAKIEDYLSKLPSDTGYSEFQYELQRMGFERRWGNNAERILGMTRLLSDNFQASDPSILETFLGNIPMVFNVVILSIHTYFGQANVLGKSDTSGQIVYILDQVGALKNVIRLKLKHQGLDIKPRILIVNRLKPDAKSNSCSQQLERVSGTEHIHTLRVPFRTDKGNLRKWVSRFDVWHYFEKFAADTASEIAVELHGTPGLIIGNCSAVFDPKFNIVSPGADMTIYFSYTEKDVLTNQFESLLSKTWQHSILLLEGSDLIKAPLYHYPCQKPNLMQIISCLKLLIYIVSVEAQKASCYYFGGAKVVYRQTHDDQFHLRTNPWVIVAQSEFSFISNYREKLVFRMFTQRFTLPITILFSFFLFMDHIKDRAWGFPKDYLSMLIILSGRYKDWLWQFYMNYQSSNAITTPISFIMPWDKLVGIACISILSILKLYFGYRYLHRCVYNPWIGFLFIGDMNHFILGKWIMMDKYRVTWANEAEFHAISKAWTILERTFSSHNLEDKVIFNGGGNVMPYIMLDTWYIEIGGSKHKYPFI